MGSVTWGVNGEGRASVFCSKCRTVFARNIDLHDASEMKEEKQKTHECTGAREMKNIIRLYRKRPAYTCACIALSVAMVAMAAIFVSPWAGALLVVAAVVLLDDCGEVEP